MRLIDADALDLAFTMLRFNDNKTLKHWGDRQDWCMSGQEVEDLINSVPTIEPESQWIPIKWHDCTDEDREKYGFSNDIVVVFDCEMPSDEQEILITTSHGYVYKDVCYIDDGFSLDSGYDWIEDIIAWMPLPEPYKEESDG